MPQIWNLDVPSVFIKILLRKIKADSKFQANLEILKIGVVHHTNPL